MTPEETAWVAGILEGEGCFSLTKRKSTAGEYYSFAMVLKMTDRDVVEKAFGLWGAGRFGGPYQRNKAPEGKRYKDQYVWVVTGQEDFKKLGEAILPYMGERRSEKIRLMLSIIASQPPRPRWRHATRQGYEVGCRCPRCKKAHAERFMKRRRKRGVPERLPSPHGTRSKYVHGCRCTDCRSAALTYERTRSKKPK